MLILLGVGFLLAGRVRVDRARGSRDPMFRLPLFRIRAFTFGTLSTFLSAVARGGLMFMLIIWLQGIWLPLHGYSFTQTPLWAGHLHAAADGRDADRRADVRLPVRPLRGAAVRDRRDDPRRGQLRPAAALLPTDFSYPVFAAILLLNGVSMGMFASPNRAGVMNSLPPGDRGAGGGMNQTFQNSAQVLSVGIFFTLMIIGLSASLPHTLATGLEAHGVAPRPRAASPPTCRRCRSCSPPSSATTRSSTCSARTCSPRCRRTTQALLTGRSFFPQLISAPFRHGLHEAFASRSSPA